MRGRFNTSLPFQPGARAEPGDLQTQMGGGQGLFIRRSVRIEATCSYSVRITIYNCRKSARERMFWQSAPPPCAVLKIVGNASLLSRLPVRGRLPQW